MIWRCITVKRRIQFNSCASLSPKISTTWRYLDTAAPKSSLQRITMMFLVDVQSYRHQICDFSRDIILYDFEHSNIGTIFDSINYSWCYVMIRIDTWLSILYLIMGYSTFKLYNSSQPCKKVVIELKFIIIWNLSRDLLQGIHKIWTWLNAIFYFS